MSKINNTATDHGSSTTPKIDQAAATTGTSTAPAATEANTITSTAATTSHTDTSTANTDSIITTDTSTEAEEQEQPTIETEATKSELPADYMEGGILEPGTKVVRARYLKENAEQIAKILIQGENPITVTAFDRKLMKPLKQGKKRGTSEAEQKSYAAKMEVVATQLVLQKKAPAVLEQMIQRMTAHVSTKAEFEAAYEHFNAVYTQMLKLESTKKKTQAVAEKAPFK